MVKSITDEKNKPESNAGHWIAAGGVVLAALIGLIGVLLKPVPEEPKTPKVVSPAEAGIPQSPKGSGQEPALSSDTNKQQTKPPIAAINNSQFELQPNVKVLLSTGMGRFTDNENYINIFLVGQEDSPVCEGTTDQTCLTIQNTRAIIPFKIQVQQP